MKKNLILSYLAYVFVGVQSLIFPKIAISASGLSGYGNIIILNSIFSILVLANLGVNQTIARYSSIYAFNDSQFNLNNFVATALISISPLLFVLLIIINIAPEILFNYFGVFVNSFVEYQIVGIIFSLYLISSIFLGINFNILYGIGKIYEQKLATIFQSATLLTAAFSFGIFKSDILLYSSFAFSSIITYAVTYVYLYRIVGLRIKEYIKISNFRLKIFEQHRSFSLNSFAILLSSTVIYSTDSLVLGFFLDSNSVAQYESVYRIIFLGTYTFTVFQQLIYPSLIDKFESRNEHGVKEMVFDNLKTTAVVSGAAALIIFSMANSFISNFYNINFSDIDILIYVLLTTYIFHIIAGPCTLYIQSTNDNSLLTKFEVLNAILNLLISIYFVKYIGLVGAALGTVVSMAITTGFIYPFIVYKRLNINFFRVLFNVLKIIFAFAICALIINTAKTGTNGFAYDLFATSLGVLLYAIITFKMLRQY